VRFTVVAIEGRSDLVAWSNAGDDPRVCSGELDIVRKAAT
jgi:hypothetical protein